MRGSERIRAGLLALRMLPWSATLPLLKRVLPAPQLVRLLGAPRARPRDERRERAIEQAAWWASRVQVRRFPDNCLERSLVAYRYLGLAGAEPQLVMGVSREAEGIVGHAWVVSDGTAVFEATDPELRFGRVVAFGPDGRLLEGPRDSMPHRD